ncbi:Zinc finger CCCH domain-containing protein 46 [Morus notabilis]|uniref:Zinc finger CCCH domain-containing protein 46 n=1 Tax=Morus notabilis TaxID=981085 RepID=W9S744_9ROSA|nr:Zinc finger CCCH domain-containing protein 46 [Morus notabilis]
MDSYEASRTVFSRIQSLEPENATKIMGYLLIQDYGEKEMIRLAFGPESLLHNLIIKAKTHLAILPKSSSSSSSSSSIFSSSPLNLISEPNPFSSPPLSYASALNKNISFGSSLYNSTSENLVEEILSPTSAYFESSENVNSGFGFRPCLYFARGFCKNGNTCRFLHGDSAFENNNNNTSNELEQCQDLLRLKKAAHSQFITGPAASFPYDNNSVSLLMQHQIDPPRSPTGAMMIGEEVQKFGRCRFERNESIMNPSSRQIYLTFPADSTFREEDVSNYFSIYGPVQDVRIPYQQKRMFGFVTFMYSETVKFILAKGNPHFVCDSRVLVKPYKEKGKIVEKKQLQQQQQQQQLDSGDYSLCSSPSGLDYDLHHGPSMFYNNTQEMLLMKKLEERANYQQAIELHGRRLMNLQLMDLKNHNYHRQAQFHRSLSSGSSIPFPNALPYSPKNRVLFVQPDETEQYVSEENNGGLSNGREENGDTGKELAKTDEESDLNESIEHILPDSLFASPKKSAVDHTTILSNSSEEPSEMTNGPLLSNSTLNLASPESVFSKCSGTLLAQFSS